MTLLAQKRLTFAEYMDQALYGPEGYYASGRARSGGEGDYFTAPDAGSVMGPLLAEIFQAWQTKLDISPFQILEAGAGEGALARQIRAQLAQAKTPFPYIAIERSPKRREKLEQAGVTVVSELSQLAEAPASGCLFGNELLDAFPVHRVRMRNGWLEEAYIEDGQLIWDTPSTNALTAYLDRIQVELPEGYETEINLVMAGWFKSAAAALKQGLILLIDYGRPAHDYYAPERDRGTLRSFRKHQVGSDFLSNPGSADLTADVDFTSAALDARAAGLTPLAFMDQGSFLMEGAKRMGEGLLGHSATLQYLIHPDGMGTAFQVLILGKDVSLAPDDFPNNRLRRLGLEELYAATRR